MIVKNNFSLVLSFIQTLLVIIWELLSTLLFFDGIFVFKIYFYLCVCVWVCVCVHVHAHVCGLCVACICVSFGEAEEYIVCEPTNVGAGNGSLVLWKNIKYS